MSRSEHMPPHGVPPQIAASASLLPCRKCGYDTPHPTLSALGGQCRQCHDDWCREGHPWPAKLPPVPREVPAGRVWAWALWHREQAGEDLSPVQRAAWRAVRRERPQTVDEVPA